MGAEDSWSAWSFQAKSFLAMVGPTVGRDIDSASRWTEVVAMSSLEPDRQEQSCKVFYLLTMMMRGAPLQVLRAIEENKGYGAWRQLCRRYGSK